MGLATDQKSVETALGSWPGNIRGRMALSMSLLCGLTVVPMVHSTVRAAVEELLASRNARVSWARIFGLIGPIESSCNVQKDGASVSALTAMAAAVTVWELILMHTPHAHPSAAVNTTCGQPHTVLNDLCKVNNAPFWSTILVRTRPTE
jgi:hypothetical protein